jgi:CO/xanthine dehydrogenase Mo-binding subunit
MAQDSPEREQAPTESNTSPTGQMEASSPQRPFWVSASANLDDWIAIEPEGTVIAYSGKVETGTGVRTALAQIVAEELEVGLDRVHLIMGDTGRAPDEGYTAGSMTVRMSGGQLRMAAAEARLALMAAAADRLGVSMEQLEARDGVITLRDAPERSISYGGLYGGRLFARQISGTAPLKRPQEYRIVGADARRVDLAGKFTGAPSFVHDLRLPGMLHGRVVRSRRPAARVLAVDAGAIRDAQIIRLGNFIGVVAEREEQAIKAASQIRVTWEELDDLPPMGSLFEWMRDQPAVDHVVAESGDTEDAMRQAAKRAHAIYEQPFQAHASIGPSCAVAEEQDGTLTVWASSGGVYPLRGALADLLNMAPERIRVIHMEGAGAYGQNGSEDVAADAALLAHEVDRPVRVQWSRRDEFIGEPKAAAMVMEVTAGLDEDGRIVAWRYDVWTPSHTNRPRTALGLLAGCEAREQLPQSAAGYFMGGARNAPTNYALPNQRVMIHSLIEAPLRTSSMRTLGGAGNTFANESCMDELAYAAEMDPLAYRLRHLEDQRGRAALEAAARSASWGDALPAGEGLGISFACYENDQAYVAMVAHVAVDEVTGAVRVRRIVVAHDCGLIVNPDGVRNQVEGNVIQALSRALKEEVRFDAGGQTTMDWEAYPLLTFSEAPEVEIVLLNRPDEPALGAGEPATVTVAAAVANAVYAATRARLRRAPFTPDRVRTALAAR